MSLRGHADHGETPSIRRVVAAAWSCLETRTRRKVVISSLIAAVLAGVDAVAIGLLPSLIHRFEADPGTDQKGWSAPALGAAVAGLLVMKSAAGAVLVRWQSAFLAHDEYERTISLFRHLLHLPYIDTAQVNTNEFVRDLHLSVPRLYRGASAGLAILIADALGLAGLVAVVMMRSPVTGLVLFVFLVAAAQLYAALIRSRVNLIGRREHDEEADCLRDLNESLGGLKTVKAFGVEEVPVRRFARTRGRYAATMRDFMVYQQLTRIYMEVVLVAGLGACLGAVYLVDGRAAVLTAFGLLTGVAARAMPALLRVLNAVTMIKLAGAPVLSLEPHLRHLEAMGESTALEPSRGITNDLVALEGVRFRYPGARTDALRDVSLELRPGVLVAILGESGRGKTTLVDVLIGLLSAQQGVVRAPAPGTIGYVAQETFVWDDTVRFNVAMDRPPVGGDVDAEIWAGLEAAQLAEWVHTLPDGLDTRLGERGNRMSGGQRQRLGLARAVYGHPSTLVLDEPTSALDGETSRALLTTLVGLKGDIGIVVVTHDPVVMEFSDRTITLEAAAVAHDAPLP